MPHGYESRPHRARQDAPTCRPTAPQIPSVDATHPRDQHDAVSDPIICGRELRAFAVALPEGFDREKIARDAGLRSGLENVHADECTEEAVLRVWRAIMAQTDDPTIPLEVGARMPFGTYEVVEYLAASCSTVIARSNGSPDSSA